MSKILEKPLENTDSVWYNKDAVNESGCLKGELPMNRQSNSKITALYERLSHDDERAGESLSIENQKKILEDYAVKQGFTNISHYTDDGISGTRFDRPGFVKMMDNIEAGKIQTILCKDTSRLGRDYLRVGLFMEKLRDNDVRLIALGDGVDTLRGEDDFLPFRNIIHEWYARDTSRKIKAVKRANGMNGKYAGSHPPYGYIKSESDKTKWEIDPEAADVVRRIFRLVLEGHGICSIATILKKDKIYCPSYHAAQQERGNFKTRKFEDPYRWYGTTVNAILERKEYMGHMVNFKSDKTSFKDKMRKPVPPEEWVIFENRHEAIIDPETWQAANDVRQKARRSRPDSLGEPHPLSGLLYCADCGSKMRNLRGLTKSRSKPRDSYCCGRSKHGNKFCTGHTIQASAVKNLVLETLRRVSKYAIENEQEFSRQIHEIFSSQQADTVKSQRKKLTASQKRHGELDKLIQRIYEDNIAERITDKRFEILSAEYEREQSDLEQIITQIQTEIDSFDDSADRAEKFLELSRRYQDFSELTAPMLYEFVDKIYIHERAERKVRFTTQAIDIYLNFIGAYIPPVEEEEQDPADIAEQERLAKDRLWQRDYRKRRKANDGKPLGRPKGPKPDNRTPEEKAAIEAERKVRHKAYMREWHRKKKEAEATS